MAAIGPKMELAGSVGASVHPMVTVTQTNSYTEGKVERSTTDSSPSQSQMSRTSSKKSNTSVLVTNGKIEGKTFLIII